MVRDPATVAVAFVRTLRQAGLTVPVDASVRFVEALDVLDPGDPDQVYWAGRATLVRRREDQSLYELVFAGFFGGEPIEISRPTPPQTVALAVDDPDAETPGPDEVDPGPALQVRFSRTETLRQADFARMDEAELAEAWLLIDRLRLVGAPRPSRRAERSPRGRPDLRRTVRNAIRHGGEPIERAHTRPGERHRRVVFLVDVSGSMEPYARALLRFTHAAVAAGGRVEAFAVGTRLTRMTRELTRRDPDAALAAAAAAIEDFSGGTRLGAGLRAFNDRWGQRGMARGAVVVILSDGWDRGDPDELTEQMVRLSRVAHRVVWVNPLKASPGYAPLARGMAAALPHVDAFVEGHNLVSLERLSSVLAGRAPAAGDPVASARSRRSVG
ncbi:MAG: vWA domain-containing protein [Acidimicrobiales bacterium]